MGSTYLELTNRVLSRLNEVPLDVDNFVMARGLHNTVKQVVFDTIQKINKGYFQWPWNAAQHSMTLAAGIPEYAWPINFSNVDWKSFTLDEDITNGINQEALIYKDRNTWYKGYRERDSDAGSLGVGIPKFVFESHGNGFGISPSPNANYQITFRYYKNPDPMVNAIDRTTIPSDFDYVIVDGAMYHMKLFKEDIEGTGFMKQEFDRGMKEMRDIYSRRQDALTDTRIRRW